MIELGVFEWFEENAAAHFAKHGVRFEAVADFDQATAIEIEDNRSGETRFLAYGLIRLHALVYFPTPEGRLRIISLRKANAAREIRLYQAYRSGRR